LGQTIAKKPQNLDGIKSIVERIRTELGENTLVEVAAAVAQGESNTKVTDCTCKTPLPSAMFAVMRRAIPMMKMFS
jgi:hypothetical protein